MFPFQKILICQSIENSVGKLKQNTGKNKLPIKIKIIFQNKLGEAVNGKVEAFRGFTGIRKKPTPIIVKPLKGGRKLISLIGDDGTHLTSYVLSKKRYELLVRENFWLLKKRNI